MLHRKDLQFGHHWLVVPCEPGEATNLRIKKGDSMCAKLVPVTQVQKYNSFIAEGPVVLESPWFKPVWSAPHTDLENGRS